jgi:ribosome biogenesis GTPase
MVRESGAAPLVVLNKADLVLPEELPRLLLGAQEMATGAPVAAVAAHTGEGLEELAPFLQPGRTIALVGSSGAGKSTLINRLLGEERLATGQVREHDRRGQHTTTHRELVVLPTGALLIDNPGLRELQLWDAADGLAETFEDVEARAARCRFRDCRHQAEPGCAVRAAVEEGDLDPDRLRNYHALTRELENLELRRDGGAQRLEKRRWKAIHSEMKRLRKHSPKP